MFFFSPWKSNSYPWKSLENLKKVPVKRQICPWNFTKIMPVKKKLMHVKKFGKIPRKNTNFCQICARERKKRGREKTRKWAKKWAWNWFFAREKIEKMAQNGFHGHFLFSREKKNTVLNTWFFSTLARQTPIHHPSTIRQYKRRCAPGTPEVTIIAAHNKRRCRAGDPYKYSCSH